MAGPLVHRIKILLWAILLIIGFCILACWLLLWNIDYADFARNLLNAVGKQDWRSYFETRVFPPARFQLLQYMVPFFLFFWFGIAYYFYRNGTQISEQIVAFFIRLKQSWSNHIRATSKAEFFFLGCILIAFALRGWGQLYTYELQYDEAWTYNHFISKGLLISAISPNNNHILYTLFACLTDYLPLEAKYSLRLPVYLGGLATAILFYAFARSIWGKPWALVALAWFCFSPAICFYSMYARGYIFQIFFTILALWATLKLLEKKAEKNYYWVIWILANVLGLYSVPTHAYVFLALSGALFVGLLLSSKMNWKSYIKANLVFLLLAAILYFPFMITNGLTTLLNANVDSTQSQILFFNYQDNVADWLLVGGGRGTRVYWFWMLLLFVMSGIAYRNWTIPKFRNPILIAILLMLLPTVFNLFLGSQPPFRVWCFLTVFCAMGIAMIGQELLGNRADRSLLILLSLGLMLFSIQRTEVHYAIRWSAKIDQEAKKIAHLMLAENIKTCYFFANYDKPLLEFYYLRSGHYLNTAMAYSDSKNYQPFVDAPLYESVCWDKEDGRPTAAQEAWFQANYPTVFYANDRIEIRLPRD